MPGLLPVTTQPPFCPGFWGSPYGRPQRIELRHHDDGYRIPKGVWMVRTGCNRVMLIFVRNCERMFEDMCGPPGTGLIRPPDDWKPSAPGWWNKPHVTPYRTRRTERLQFDDEGDYEPPADEAPAETTAVVPRYNGHGGGWGHNREERWELVRQNSTGVVFADGWSVLICGSGWATLIRVY